MKKIIAILIVVMAILSLVACGCSDESTETTEDTSYIVRKPKGDTAAERLCWLYEDMSYRRDISYTQEMGMEWLEAYISALNQSGAIITSEATEKICKGVVRYYRYERGKRSAEFAEMTEDGINTFVKCYYGGVTEEGRAQLEERGLIYKNCITMGHALPIDIVKTYLGNDETKQLISRSEEGSQGLEYELSTDRTYYILRGIGTCKDRDLVIPGMYNGKPVRIVDLDTKEDNYKITSIRFSDSVEVIESLGGYEFGELYSVTFAKGNSFVNPYVFNISPKLIEVNNFSYVDKNNFDMYVQAEYKNQGEGPSRVHITKDDFAFYVSEDKVILLGYVGDKKDITLPKDYNGSKYVLGRMAFADRKKDRFEKITLSEGITEIGEYAFRYSIALTNPIIPNSVTKIGTGAFYEAELESVTIPNTVKTIESNAFDSVGIMYCEAPSKPEGWYVGEIGALDWSTARIPIVWDCKNNEAAQDGYIHVVVDGIRYGIANGVATVLYQDKRIEDANILQSVTFKGVTYPVTSIGKSAFVGCEKLKGVTIPKSVTSIGEDAFGQCRSLTEIAIPSSITSIGKRAFYNCESLAKIIIPRSVTSIGDLAFGRCESLTIYCEEQSKPEGWHTRWQYDCYVEWGYTE